MYKRFIKRQLDILLSGTALIILSPLLIIITVLVRINLGSPVIFKQQRPGMIDIKTKKEKLFQIYKFIARLYENNKVWFIP